jgi:PKD domain
MAASSNRRLAAVLVIVAALLVALTAAPAARANAGDPLDYYGGPVVHSVTGVVVAWGSNVNPMFTNSTSGDPGLLKSFVAANGSTGDVGGVLAQYANAAYVDNGSTVGTQTFEGSGQTIPAGNAAPNVTYSGEYQITPSITSSLVYDSQIQSELVSQIEKGVQNGGLPSPQGPDGLGTVYLLLFPATDAECLQEYVCGGDYVANGQLAISLCSYHGDARLPGGTIALYEVLPDDTLEVGGAQAISQACGPSSSALANETSYASHEWMESITDPLVGEANLPSSTQTNDPPLSWYDNNCPADGLNCGEAADKCNQQQAVVGGFTVQLVWSNLDAACESTEPSYSQPTASFAAASSGIVGQPVSFDASGSSDPSEDQTSATAGGATYSITPGIASYAWNWGDGSATATGVGATHTFSAPGQYQVSLTVTDDMGFSSTVTHAVEVSSATPTTPVATTGAATDIDSADATLNGTVDTGGQPVSYQFVYGTSPGSLTQSTPVAQLAPASSPEPVSATLTGLAPSATYYYQLVVGAGGQPGQVQSFMTSAVASSTQTSNPPTTTTPTTPPTTTTSTTTPPATSTGSGATTAAPRLPSVATGGVSGVASSRATVSGSVNPDGSSTTYLVEFGTSTAYGHSSPSVSAGAGSSPVSVSATLTGLRPRTVYHYRVVATNAAGTSVGADRTFKTPAAPPPPPRFSFRAPNRMTVAALLAGKLRVSFRCSSACTAHFAVTVALSGIQRLSAIPVTLARGTGHLRRAGAGHATLFFTRASRGTLSRRAAIKLVVTGYAVRGNSNPSPPRTLRLLATR